MTPRNAHDEQMAALRERLSRLSEASLRINESLDLDAVLQGVLDSARSLTEARYALITTMRDTGEVEDFVVSGLTAEEAQRLWEVPEGMQLFSYFSSIPGSLRVPDFAAHMREMGLPDYRLPVPISSFIAAPIRHRGVSVGNIHVAKDLPGLEFSQEDEETLVMFASQVALVVANARQAPGRTARQGGPRNPDRHLARRRRRLRHGDRCLRCRSTARRGGSSTACGTRTRRRNNSCSC